jgi:ADP-ribose pyrophosphatase YjhB (NUDIX family)
MLAGNTAEKGRVTSIEPKIATPRIRVAAVILKGDKILLVRHRKGARKYWLLPGGGVEYGESLAEGLVRELEEESGFIVSVGDLVMVNDTIDPAGSRHTVNLYFRADILDGRLVTGADGVLEEVAFVPIKEVWDLPFFPDIREDLVAAIESGFPDKAAYLGRVWKDQE